MVPFAEGNLTNEQIYFNNRLQKARNVVERCIGVLKMRFRCILAERKLRYYPTRASHIINACATIHNFLILNNYNIEGGLNWQDGINGEEEFELENDDGAGDRINANQVGMATRNEICNHLQLHIV